MEGAFFRIQAQTYAIQLALSILLTLTITWKQI